MSDCAEDICNKMGSNRSSTASPVYFNSKSEASSGYYSSSPPTPTTPQSISPPHTLKRSKSSSFRLINRRISTISTCSQLSIPQEPEDRLAAVIGWYPALIVRISLELLSLSIFVVLKRLPFMLPTLWLSVNLWIFWKMVLLPLSIVKSMLVFIFVPPSERHRKKRTVLISGGSSVQAVYLARNFCSAGARVVVCEVNDSFHLARFSTAVHRYYTVPQPDDDHIDEYIEAMKRIVLEEKVQYFIPVSEKNTAYYDALIKPHIEVLGCECVCPDLREVLFLDDTYEMMRQVDSHGMPTPAHYLVQNSHDLNRLYELGVVKQESHVMVNVGVAGCKNRMEVELTPTRRRLKLSHPINEQNPWLVLQQKCGDKYVTCTTVRQSQVMCNVTCKVDACGGLVPVVHEGVEEWLKRFFASLKTHRDIVGHMSFYFTVTPENGQIYPDRCEVGVRQPYTCYTSVQSRIVWKPCKHFSRNKSGPVVANTGIYWLNKVARNTLKHLSPRGIWDIGASISGRHDALFVVWDPLPYCAYYYVELPWRNIRNVLKKF